METPARKEPLRVRRADRRWQWAALVLGTFVVSIGCSPRLLTLLVLPWVDDKIPPRCQLASSHKEIKVVIVAAFDNQQFDPHLLQANEQLAVRLEKSLEKQFAENKEQVKVVSASQVKSYQSRHPRWRLDPPQTIGSHFKADYVINLEIKSMTLQQAKNTQQFYEGGAEIMTTVTDVHKPVGEGEMHVYHKSWTYPTHPVPVDEMSPVQFRTQFLERIAKDLCQEFAAHPPKDKYDSD